MASNYIVDIQIKYKDWISKYSIFSNKPIYSIFENILFPFYKENFNQPNIPKVSFKDIETSRLVLSAEFKQTLKLEAYEKGRTTIITLVDTVFQFYLDNHKD